MNEISRADGRVPEVRSTPTGDGGAVRIYTDVTDRRVAERRVRYLAEHDELTRLVNRPHFGAKLDAAMEEARRRREGFTLLYVDLDGFKQVNDLHGHATGDAVLVEVAQRMKAAVRSSDTVARIGGDEFAILLTSLTDAAVIQGLAGELIARVSDIRSVRQCEIELGASVGAAVFPDHGQTREALLQHADMALYEAKRSGKNTVRFASAPLAR